MNENKAAKVAKDLTPSLPNSDITATITGQAENNGSMGGKPVRDISTQLARDSADQQTTEDAHPQLRGASQCVSKASTDAVKEAPAKPAMQECIACTESFGADSFPRPEHCKGVPSLCGDCFATYLNTQIGQSASLRSIKCPCGHDECAVFITWTDVKLYAKGNTFDR